MSKRKCTCCGEDKDLSEFYSGDSYSDGYSTQCKECKKRKSRIRRRKKREESNDGDKDDLEKLRNELYNQNIYLKKTKDSHNLYYYLRPDNCICEGEESQCMYCHLATSSIIEDIKKKDEDFWNEQKVRGLSLYSWKSKVKKGAEIIYF